MRCKTCDGTGQISLDVQFLPDVTITCPDCQGKRYGQEIENLLFQPKNQDNAFSLAQILSLTVSEALPLFKAYPSIASKLSVLENLGLGYLNLNEDTPALSGGEAQRLKLASEMGRTQTDAVFVFDEPTIGLHPKDVQVLLKVFETLVSQGATLVVIEHDLDVIFNADYIIDMGPLGGEEGGEIVAQGPPLEIIKAQNSLTGKYLAPYFKEA